MDFSKKGTAKKQQQLKSTSRRLVSNAVGIFFPSIFNWSGVCGCGGIFCCIWYHNRTY